jgi:hypothetical protein
VRLIIHSTEPVEEIAAEPDTLARFRTLLQLTVDHAAEARGPVIRGSRGWLAMPLVADPNLPPLTVHLRPYSAPPETPDRRFRRLGRPGVPDLLGIQD